MLNGCTLQAWTEALELVHATESYSSDSNNKCKWVGECENANKSNIVFKQYCSYMTVHIAVMLKHTMELVTLILHMCSWQLSNLHILLLFHDRNSSFDPAITDIHIYILFYIHAQAKSTWFVLIVPVWLLTFLYTIFPSSTNDSVYCGASKFLRNIQNVSVLHLFPAIISAIDYSGTCSYHRGLETPIQIDTFTHKSAKFVAV